MTDEQKKALEEIEGQLYAINARNISMRWIALRKIPTQEEISELNALLGFIILEIRTLRETGKMDKDALHKKEFPELYPEDISLCPSCNCMTKTIKNHCGKCKAKK